MGVNYINAVNVSQINEALLSGELQQKGVFPHLDSLALSPVVFTCDFGLGRLPTDAGLILIRGARQYGKSTWLEQQLRDSVQEHGAGCAFYLNGDEIRDSDSLAEAVRGVVALFHPDATVRRVFIDEITAVEDWQKAIKRLVDAGELRDVLVVTTGSKATDLRRGSERLPGRRGKLSRSTYYFTPVSFSEFRRVCAARLGDSLLPAYLLSGGCPVAASEIAVHGLIPGYVIEMIRDWIFGECSAAGRNRPALVGAIQAIIRSGGQPCGQAGLARDAGLANNTVAAGYVELLMDLMCLSTTLPWEKDKKVHLRRKPAKYHFTNLLCALAWHPDHPLSVESFLSLPHATQGLWYEWAVAQELWRRAAVAGEDFPEIQSFWKSDKHELDFVTGNNRYIEVKRGRSSPQEFLWFARSFGKDSRLTIINEARFETDFCTGVTLEDFLLNTKE